MNNANVLQAYTVGDTDSRPWGSYVVTATGLNGNGEEFCEKLITVDPDRILSLQSHRFRRERWTVHQGILTVVLNDKRLMLTQDESIDIPLGAVHCMANLGETPCIVHEIQEGLCREEDIIRYVDTYGRGTEASDHAKSGIAVYTDIMKEIAAKTL